MAPSTLHVEPVRGGWVVREEPAREPVSVYDDATAATLAAERRARDADDMSVLLRDRYGRVRRVVGGPRTKSP